MTMNLENLGRPLCFSMVVMKHMKAHFYCTIIGNGINFHTAFNQLSCYLTTNIVLVASLYLFRSVQPAFVVVKFNAVAVKSAWPLALWRRLLYSERDAV